MVFIYQSDQKEQTYFLVLQDRVLQDCSYNILQPPQLKKDKYLNLEI
jgi:hypothetical protein